MIVLDKTVHTQVSAQQAQLDAASQTPRENITANAQILRDLNVAPESDINALEQAAIAHAQKHGY